MKKILSKAQIRISPYLNRPSQVCGTHPRPLVSIFSSFTSIMMPSSRFFCGIENGSSTEQHRLQVTGLLNKPDVAASHAAITGSTSRHQRAAHWLVSHEIHQFSLCVDAKLGGLIVYCRLAVEAEGGWSSPRAEASLTSAPVSLVHHISTRTEWRTGQEDLEEECR